MVASVFAAFVAGNPGDGGRLAPTEEGEFAPGRPASKLEGDVPFPLDQSLLVLMDGREDGPPSLKTGGA